MKRTIRLTESDLHRIIEESVKRIMNEGGHIYFRDEDGVPHTNSKETFRGVPGSTFIWHGEWADPEIWWKGEELNATDVEDGMWNSYEVDCEETGETPTNDGYEKWLEEMGTDWIASQLDEYVWVKNGCP